MSDLSPGPPDTGPGEDPQDRTDERERYSCAEACETVEGGRARDYRVSARRIWDFTRTVDATRDHALCHEILL